ncbi:hypothetical protein J437_LFUL009275 [Ladona fulva]|uniref:PDZ domain-containing protein n=1 Tax=Ladona fulva TaxID=123851 RepID=A0A8K0K9A0_LADFU|nr:hypothetical protein J437_LFUL009275 [Ladona fulva]
MPWKCFSCIKSDTEDIVKLDYRHYSLTDVPPEVFAFERTLEELYLDANRIKDLPRPLFHCHGLRHLGLSDNEVQNIPAAISSLVNLEHLDISKNGISDIPDNIKGCKLLKIVDASVNPLEKLPEGFMQLLALEELYLNDAYLEFLPANFGRLLKLRILELRENHLNTLPKSIARLVNLQRLDIGQNEFSDLDVPDTIGNLCSLMTLKLDDNQLAVLPDSIGRLSNLEELILSQNDFETLPSSIGLLRKLHIINVDENMLEDLPPEARIEEERIRRRHIRFAADSELDAGGRLLRAPTPYPKELRALARHARSLQRASQSANGPVSSTSPLVQGSYSSKSNEGESATPVVVDWISSGMQEIKIKEAKVTKSQTSPIIMTEVHDSGMNHNAQHPDQTPVKTENEIQQNQPQVVETIELNVDKVEDLRSPVLGKERCDDHILLESSIEVYDDKYAPDVKNKDGVVHHKEENAQKSVEQSGVASPELSSFSDKSSVLLKEVKEEQEESIRFSPNSPSVPSHPPPYHIAAAYSKKAAFFNSDVQSRSSVSSLPPINLLGGRLTPLSEMKDVTRPSSAASSKYDLPPTMKGLPVKDPNLTSSQNHEPENNDSKIMEIQDLNEPVRNSLNESNTIEEQISSYKANLSLQEKQLRTSIDSPSPKTDTTDSSMSTYQNICSVTSMEPPQPLESTSTPSKISTVNHVSREMYASSPATVQSSRITPEDFMQNLESAQIDHEGLTKHSMIEDDQSSGENSSSIFNSSPAECSFVSDVQGMEMVSPSKSGEFLSEKRHETPDLVKDSQKVGSSRIPVSRIKPVGRLANEEIREMSLGKPPNFTQDKPSAGTHLIAPTPQRANTILSSSFEGGKESASPVNDSYSGNNKLESIPVSPTRIPSVSGIPSPKTSPNWQQNSSPQYFTSKVPQPGFSLGKRSNSNLPLPANSRQEVSSPVHGVESGIPKGIQPTSPHSKIPQLSAQNNNIPSTSSGRIPVKALEPREKSPKNVVSPSKIPTLATTAWSDAPTGGDAVNKSRIPISPQSRTVKTWMFGLHKNALVFPVSIHKNPGLGFSIAGGAHQNASPDKQDTGIYITKIHPNGPASAALQPGDKILEVDGIDFTKLEHDQAVSILTQTGSIVHMMISRQQ